MSKNELKYYYRNKKKILKKRNAKNSSKYYSVYYLPNENYCGVTKMKPEKRMAHHKYKGKDVSNWRILFCSEDKLTAYHYEAMYHSVLGMFGLLTNNK